MKMSAGRQNAVEVAAIYFPHYHAFDHNSSWYGEGWTEWELVKKARPLFEGHHQPLVPDWGCFDESDPVWAAKEIDLAADHGVTTFLVDWYWYSGVQILQNQLEQGFLKASNCNRMKFALMWANHTWGTFPALSGKPGMGGQQPWLPIRHSLQDLDRLVDYCVEHYFNQPNYWRIDDKPYFSIYDFLQIDRQLQEFGGLSAVVERLQARAQHHGLAGLYLNTNLALGGDIYCWRTDLIPFLRKSGIDSVFGYNIVRTPGYGDLSESKPLVDYSDVIQSHIHLWRESEKGGLPFFPVVTVGCDVSPRWHQGVSLPMDFRALSYEPIIVGNTPPRFGELCRHALDHLAQSSSMSKVLFINAWNEWTEGMYLLPESRYGTGYLTSLKAALNNDLS